MWNLLRSMRWSRNPAERFGARAVLLLVRDFTLIFLTSVGLAALWLMWQTLSMVSPDEVRDALQAAQNVWRVSMFFGAALCIWKWS